MRIAEFGELMHISRITKDQGEMAIKGFATIQALKKYMRPAGTWKYAHAALSKEEKLRNDLKRLFGDYLDEAFICKNNQDTLNEVYQDFSVYSVQEFLSYFLPNMALDLEKTLSLLSNRPPEVQCAYILNMRQVQASRAAYPELTHWEIYRELFVNEKRPGAPRLTKDAFSHLYTAVNCYDLSFKSKIINSSIAAVDKFRQAKFTNGQAIFTDKSIIEYYMSIRTLVHGGLEGNKSKMAKGISSPSHYLRSRFGMKPEYDPLELDYTLNEAAKEIAKIRHPSDFLRALRQNKDTDDTAIEIDFVQMHFLKNLMIGDDILVINPSPDFILNWPDDMSNNVIFCVEYEVEAELYQEEFPDRIRVISFAELGSIASGPTPEPPPYGDVLLFCRGLTEKRTAELLAYVNALREKDGYPSNGESS